MHPPDNRFDGERRRRTARVSGSVIPEALLPRIGAGQIQQRLILRKILAVEALRIALSVERRQNPRTVHPLPVSESERNLRITVEGTFPPLELLRRKADQSGMRRDGRQRVGEAETVGQEDVARLATELPLVELLSQQYVAEERFGRGYVGIGRIPRRAADVPAPLLDVWPDLPIRLRIILLHPVVLDRPFEIEHVVGIVFQQPQILIERIADIGVDGRFHIPVPLRIEVGVRHHVEGWVRLLGCKARRHAATEEGEQSFHLDDLFKFKQLYQFPRPIRQSRIRPSRRSPKPESAPVDRSNGCGIRSGRSVNPLAA